MHPCPSSPPSSMRSFSFQLPSPIVALALALPRIFHALLARNSCPPLPLMIAMSSSYLLPYLRVHNFGTMHFTHDSPLHQHDFAFGLLRARPILIALLTPPSVLLGRVPVYTASDGGASRVQNLSQPTLRAPSVTPWGTNKCHGRYLSCVYSLRF
jgi:hypothetical protein